MNIGKTKIKVETEGCVDCGTRWSHAWFLFEQIEVKVGDLRPMIISIHICGDCQQQREQKLFQTETPELALK